MLKYDVVYKNLKENLREFGIKQREKQNRNGK